MKIDDKEFEKAFSEEEEKKPSRGKKSEEVLKVKLNKSVVTSTVFDWLGSLFIALICVLIVMTFFVRVIDVDGPSMEPTLINTDKVVITDLFYTPHRGDIVVISHGNNYPNALIKRVIATEGETIAFKDAVALENGKVMQQDYEIINGEVYVGGKPYEGDCEIKENVVMINGEVLEESYITDVTLPGERPAEETVPEGMVYVMGDHRSVSLDSRSNEVGLIKVSDIIGKAQIVVIPHTRDANDQTHLDLSKIRYLYD